MIGFAPRGRDHRAAFASSGRRETPTGQSRNHTPGRIAVFTIAPRATRPAEISTPAAEPVTTLAGVSGKPLTVTVRRPLRHGIEQGNEAIRWLRKEWAAGVERISPGELGQPHDIAAAIAFLAAPEAAFVQGAALVVDGGRLARL